MMVFRAVSGSYGASLEPPSMVAEITDPDSLFGELNAIAADITYNTDPAVRRMLLDVLRSLAPEFTADIDRIAAEIEKAPNAALSVGMVNELIEKIREKMLTYKNEDAFREG